MISLRSVKPSDAPELAGLLTQLGYPTTPDQVLGRLDTWLHNEHSVLVAAELDGAVVGVVALHAMPLFEHDGYQGRVVALVVDESCRRHGVGRALMARVEDEARRLGCFRMEITSSRDREAAQQFYRGLGYEDFCGRSSRLLKELGSTPIR